MRKTELFHAYLDGSISPEQTEQLKEILRTEEGSEEFVRFMAESKTICELLDKREAVENTPISKTRRPLRKKKSKAPVIAFLTGLAACAVFAFVILNNQPTGFTDLSSNVSIKKGQTVKAAVNEAISIKSNAGDIKISNSGSLKVIDRNSVEINNGTFEFDMARRKKDDSFTVKMTNGKIKILGTVFKIHDSANGSSVSVSEGCFSNKRS